jgi:hypothetical protein
MQSLAHNQISAPKFVNMVKYGWYKSGYTEELLENFDNIIDFCFKNVFANCCAFCSEPAIIKCSHCDLYLYINHFFYDEFFHFHQDF